MRAGQFLQFLDKAADGSPEGSLEGFKLFLAEPEKFARRSGYLLSLVFILLGGIALNLTPCVLPMIPINLAILGAGARAGSKKRGFMLGASYGAGIALVYGLMGAVVVLTGSHFGTVQASPWFNFAIALIFVVLALAMFDLLHIDFSPCQSMFDGRERKGGGFSVALTMGAVAALLAGACVAPVVIAVLLLAAGMGASGLLLPFVLGLGMALPWPFAGAGLSFLPKPGKWMVYVKFSLGVGILFFAFYYGQLGYRLLNPAEVAVSGAENSHQTIDGSTNQGFAEALARARADGRPVLIDFWGSWCKNCQAMDTITFRNMGVMKRLKDFTVIKYAAENPEDPQTRAVLEHLGVQGLPTFIVLGAAEQH